MILSLPAKPKTPHKGLNLQTHAGGYTAELTIIHNQSSVLREKSQTEEGCCTHTKGNIYCDQSRYKCTSARNIGINVNIIEPTIPCPS